MTTKKALIIGGGIGGLSTALALRQIGMEVQVFEAAKEVKEVGAGITVWSNAVRALQTLGLSDRLKTIGMPALARVIYTWRGERLSHIQVEQLAHGLGSAILVCHRAELQSTLLHALGEEHVQLNAKCVRFTQDEKGVCAILEDGRAIEGDLLIAADGVLSTLREQLFGKQPFRYAGYSTWRGIAPLADKEIPVGVSSETWGQGRRIGLIPLKGGQMYWFASMNTEEHDYRDETGEQRKQRMEKLFQGWHSPIEATIAATDPASIFRAGIYEMEPLQQWCQGRVTLLGDSAHAMTPNMGQGACQAIEDAVVLGKCLSQENSIPAAFRAFEVKRIQRVQRVTLQSRRIGWLSQLEHPLACALRDRLVKQFYTGWLSRELDWLLSYNF